MKMAFLMLALVPVDAILAAKILIKVDALDGPPIRVFVTKPLHLEPDRPIVFVMHGMNRNADDYRDQWNELAKEHDFLLVVPEFNERNFPGVEAYNLGNVFDRNDNIVSKSRWSYSAIEPIFDEVRRRFSMTTPRYSLYGHSAGSQFVHRFIFHVPGARVSQVVSANAGWYMMPDFEEDYPYGLRRSAVTRDNLAAALQLPVTILLGEEDNDTEHPSLRRSPEAMAQGDHRLERGFSFYSTAKAYAERKSIPFNWQLVTVPGADHDNSLMAPAAIPYLLSQ
ncbi:alpha/beta hydrolase [Pseudomonadota bacterium]